MKATTRAVRAVAEALFCDEKGPPPAERIDWLCRDFDDFVQQAGARSGAILHGGLAVANWLAPLAIGKAPPLSRLTLAERVEALHKTEGTPAGLPLLAIKAMLCMIYYEHPDAMAEIGADSDCLVTVEEANP